MIIEHTYDNRKICYGCKHFESSSNPFEGICMGGNPRIKSQYRFATDKKCSKFDYVNQITDGEEESRRYEFYLNGKWD